MTTLAKQIVLEAATFAGVSAPRLTVKIIKGGYARYSPFSHRIVVSRRLCDLEQSDLKALIAHEVGHATQRREILADGFRILMPSVAIVVAFSVLTLWTYVVGWFIFATAVALAGVILTVIWEKWSIPRWMHLVQKREAEADAFADSFVGSGAMAQAMAACAQLQP